MQTDTSTLQPENLREKERKEEGEKRKKEERRRETRPKRKGACTALQSRPERQPHRTPMMGLEVTHAAAWSQRKTGVIRRRWPQLRTGMAGTGPRWD
ncbi:hypothetical protein SESBI_09414 [Sesbania bispinosa]|nr:hypothetical protein SESBI_09414 [Sesbania bispinosa]